MLPWRPPRPYPHPSSTQGVHTCSVHFSAEKSATLNVDTRGSCLQETIVACQDDTIYTSIGAYNIAGN